MCKEKYSIYFIIINWINFIIKLKKIFQFGTYYGNNNEDILNYINRINTTVLLVFHYVVSIYTVNVTYLVTCMLTCTGAHSSLLEEPRQG